MTLVTLHDVSIRFRGPVLLDQVTCRLDERQRIGLLGRNGTGKTTLMRMIAGEVEPDDGEVIVRPGARVAFLPQEIPASLCGPLRDIVAQGIADDDPAPTWTRRRRVETVMTRMELPTDVEFEIQSAGMKRRVLLARALAGDPDLLLLDEPTNHLDVDSIVWLERFLSGFQGTLLFVTHDRAFLRSLATRILELDRGRLFDWSCDYDTFLDRRDAALTAEARQDVLRDKKLAQEEQWIRQGIKARRTRNEGRVRALQQMRRERQERREAIGGARMRIQEGPRGGNLVALLDNVSFRYDRQYVVRDFSTLITRGDKIGVIGPNGSGKSTLLKLILGRLAPTEGTVRHGSNLRINYFDQQREQLDPEKTVRENVADGYDTVTIDGRSKHVIGYLNEFLFSADRAHSPVKRLSGGERNRLLLARLMAKEANLLVMDEPTNDLDTETLELLEERLLQYGGTLLLVSHDRTFLNNVVTSTLVMEGDGVVREYAGGYDDWLRQRAAADAKSERPARAKGGKPRSDEAPEKSSSRPSADAPKNAPPRKKTYKEQRELAALPDRIQSMETELEELHRVMADPEFYKQSGELIAERSRRADELTEEISAAYARWEELESLS